MALGRSKKFRESLGELTQLISRIQDFQDAHVVIVGTSQIDAHLRLALLSRMRKLTKKQTKQLFEGYGPLSSFSAKIDVAYALDILSEDHLRDVTQMRKIRNLFAHTQGFRYFTDDEVAEQLRNLKAMDETIPDMKFRFAAKTNEIITHLRSIYGKRRGGFGLEQGQ